MADLQTLRRTLLGSVIGLARTCTTRPPTETTPGLILAGLHLSDDAVSATPEQLIALTERIQQNKFEGSPNCATCASRAGGCAAGENAFDCIAAGLRASRQDGGLRDGRGVHPCGGLGRGRLQGV